MNGDLSLSQSLGGLRIANPDIDVEDAPSLPPGPPHRRSNSPSSRSQTSSASHLVYREADDSQHASATTDGLSVQSLGFDPTAYSNQSPAHHQDHPYSVFQHDPSGSQNPRLNHRQSMPLVQEPQQPSPYPPRSTNHNYNPTSGPRPTSGFYNHMNMSSSSGPPHESSHQRVRAESTQSAHTNVRRSNSRAGATPVSQSSALPRTSSGGVYRQGSNGGPSSNFPPRRSSKPTQNYGDSDYSSSGSRQPRLASDASARSGDDRREGNNASGSGKSSEQNGKSRPSKKGVKDFHFGRTLGEGSYSTVLAATDRVSHREFAIKVLDKRHIIHEKKVKYVNIEKDTLNRLTDHPGIVRLYYTFQDEFSLYFVLDLATGGELLGVLKKMTSFDEECSRFYGAQILDSIEYIHSRGIIHRDLKPENVLLDDQMHLKITDFGTAKILQLPEPSQFGQVSVSNDVLDGIDSDRAVSFVGTAEYVSPELLTDKNACKASDLWAFGCIIYQLLAGRPPFKASNEYQTFQKIVHLEYSFPEGFPSVAKDLIQKLLVLDPAQRLPIDAIKKHPFFTGIQWGQGLWKQKPPKLRPFDPNNQESNRPQRSKESGLSGSAPSQLSKTTSGNNNNTNNYSASAPNNPSSQRPQPRIITELAPPSQLDIDWSPVLTKTNERILKLGQFIIYSTPAPHSPTSRNGPSNDSVEQPSMLSRFFGASATKKRQRLVLVTSGGRLVIAPAGGEKKEAKQMIDLTSSDVSWRSHQDGKGYTLWSVYTRERHLTFEDPKANTGDSGLSQRSTQEWLQAIEEIRDFAITHEAETKYQEESLNAISSNITTPTQQLAEPDDTPRPETSGGTGHRRMLRKEPKDRDVDEESLNRRKRFSKRHSKNGLAAVF